MRSRRSSLRRFATVLALSGAIVAGTYAFTAANTVPASKAGDGTGTVTGYTVSAIHYGLNATNPANVDGVTFTLDSAPVAGSTLRVQLAAAGSWYSCTNAGTAVSCTTTSPQATVLGVTQLRVVVAD
jgi:hypothetical protein